MSTVAKLFMSGRSQAIRWPAQLRLNANEVEIEQIGNAFLVRPKRESHQNLGEWLHNFYATTEPLPETFLAERNDQPPQERDWR